ncbi:hypothetical protein [Brevibacillus laterosporus]|uniref:hypothetical protein n=1 Tax=Brevibacillus laterosporus TaxID=1465 RepID=UPI001443E10C|nr:hypothetical protein [Brevibacillus laterosporus]MBG9775809.1 hypothetical protein [Brevibacillus laterosporus]NKQ21587.1 hypothetical protein [Brevibacillus laterosporus]WNX31951.1 hypothetical protein RWW94_03775 [Brevibacillus laterosporus]
MSLDIGAIVAIAMAATSTLSTWLGIPVKLRAWTTLGFILLLKLGYDWLYGPVPFIWKDSLMHGITAGLAAVGIYSTTKNTHQHVRSLKNETINNEPNTNKLTNDIDPTTLVFSSQDQVVDQSPVQPFNQSHSQVSSLQTQTPIENPNSPQQSSIETALNQPLHSTTTPSSIPHSDPENLPPTTFKPSSEAPFKEPTQSSNDSSDKKSSYEDYV